MTGRLITGIEAERAMRAIQSAGAVPRDSRGAAESSRKTLSAIQERNLGALSQRYGGGTPGEAGIINEMAMNRRLGSVQMAYPKNRELLGTWKDKGIPFDVSEEEERNKIRAWSRAYYATHHLMSTAIDIYARFPVQGIEIQSKDPALTEFYEELFLNTLDYESFLISMGQEFFTVGEVTTMANFNEALGVWDAEDIINPDNIEATRTPFSRDPDIKLGVPDYLKEIVEKREPKHEYEILAREFPEIIQAVQRNQRMSVSSVLASRMIDQVSSWDTYGTPKMLRAFRLLASEESLNAAQEAVADRLYSPLVLAKLGVQDIGDGEPWIPSGPELDDFTGQIQQALAADFRLLVHHFGVDIKNVFGRESMPRLDSDYDRIERKLLQVWGIGEALLSGSSQGTYASSALNRDLVTQLMATYQKNIIKHYKKRALVVAEAQEHFDYESRGGMRVPIYDEYIEEDEYGEPRFVKKPRLLIPDLKFKTLNLSDEATERNFLQQLSAAGVPISNRALMVNIDFEFEEELEKKEEEEIKKAISRARAKKRSIELLEKQGLLKYADPELQQIMANPDEMIDPSQFPNQDLDSSGGEEGETTVNLNTDDSYDNLNGIGVPADERVETNALGGGRSQSASPIVLPRNEIKSRPEVSDSARKTMPKAARLQTDPSVVGLSKKLTEESVQDAIDSRRWTRSLKNHPNN